MCENPITAPPIAGSQEVSTEEQIPAAVEPGTSVFGRFVSSSTIALSLIGLVVVVIDQATKALARGHLLLGQPVPVIPKFFDLSLSYNSGAAFGIMPNATPLLVLIGLVLIFAIVKLRGIGKKAFGLRLGLGLLLGGAVGNLIDRVMPSHMVTDFISLHLNLEGIQHSWPNFNLADVAIVTGVVIVILGVHRVERTDPE